MNIVLIGHRCSGKSLVGKILADYLGLELADTDQGFESRVGSGIPQYVAENGWEAFRMLEKVIVRSIANLDQRVIATGGGVVLDWENVRNLKETGWVVWLRTSITSIRERMGKDGVSGKVRPGLIGENPLEEIEEILNKRTPLYERASDYIVDTDQQSPDAVAQNIIQSLPEALIPVKDGGLPRGIVRSATLNS